METDDRNPEAWRTKTNILTIKKTCLKLTFWISIILSVICKKRILLPANLESTIQNHPNLWQVTREHGVYIIDRSNPYGKVQ